MEIIHCKCKDKCNNYIKFLTREDEYELGLSPSLKPDEIEISITNENGNLSIIVKKEDLKQIR